MRIFHCDHCQQLVFFENVQCVACSHLLAYLPDVAEVGSLEPAGEGVWKAIEPSASERLYRLCQNYAVENVCNWAVPVDDPNPYCQSCRLTRVIPILEQEGRREAWFALEAAKRRLVYSLMMLGLPISSKVEDPERGLAFEFLADPETDDPSTQPVLTGHSNGLITIKIAEADDAEREKRRLAMHEPYRTLLGHFRHEVGHYYWDRLIAGSPHLARFHELFGNESENYAAALERHYQSGPPSE